jgi:hypothetical protein
VAIVIQVTTALVLASLPHAFLYFTSTRTIAYWRQCWSRSLAFPEKAQEGTELDGKVQVAGSAPLKASKARCTFLSVAGIARSYRSQTNMFCLQFVTPPAYAAA